LDRSPSEGANGNIAAEGLSAAIVASYLTHHSVCVIGAFARPEHPLALFLDAVRGTRDNVKVFDSPIRHLQTMYQAINARLNQELKNLPAGTVFSFSPPAIPGVGTSGGVSFVLEDHAGRDVPFLASNLAKFLAAARKRPEIGTISTTFIPSAPQEFVQVDKEKVLKQGVVLSDVYNTIQANMGGLFVNYYNEFGRTWQVYIESEAPYRSNTNNLGQFYVRNNQGETVPLSALASFETRSGPEFTMRYN
jgi:HAE1 family hydrophobic/amphiphilic exporter-1